MTGRGHECGRDRPNRGISGRLRLPRTPFQTASKTKLWGEVGSGARLPELQQAIWGIHVEDSLRDYIIRLARATRGHPDLALGASPRATFALFRATQARAALAGRDYAIPDDVKALVQPVWRHRLLLRPESALRGRAAAAVLDGVIAETALDLGERD